MTTGTLFGLGLGPGDPDLITLKALRILQAVPVIAWPAPEEGPSFARAIAAPHLPGGQAEIAIRMPMRVERFPAEAVYDEAAREIGLQLISGRDVAVLCEGDPFFFGSFMYLHHRLASAFPAVVVPGVSSVMAAAAASGRPLTARNDVFTVLPGPLPDEELEARIGQAGAVAIMKTGRHFPRIRALIDRMGLTAHATYAERVTLAMDEKVMPLADAPDVAPYFSMILIYKGGEDWLGPAAGRPS